MTKHETKLRSVASQAHLKVIWQLHELTNAIAHPNETTLLHIAGELDKIVRNLRATADQREVA